MHIHPIHTRTAPVAPEAGERTARSGPAAPTRGGTDQVELSATAVQLARDYAERGLTPERIQQLRRGVELGITPRPEALEELAWRLIEGGVV